MVVPAPHMFLVDRMLIRLGRWLRAAGHDAAFDEHRTSDRALLERALAEKRLLLTCDRKLAEFRLAPGHVVVLAANGVPRQAADLSAKAPIDWLWRPFSRCLLCNRPVTAADPAADGIGAVPENAPGPVTHCAACGKVYWRGGHAERMVAQLMRWNAGDFD